MEGLIHGGAFFSEFYGMSLSFETSKVINHNVYIACATDETKPWFKVGLQNSAKILVVGSHLFYQDLTTCHDWPVQKATVDLPVRMQGNLKCTSGNSLSPLGAQNKGFGAAL